MRVILGFFSGLAITLALVVLAGELWGTRRARIMQVFPHAGVEAWSKASVIISFAAFLAAISLPLIFVSTVGARKPWPSKSFGLGIAAGAIAGGILDAWCFHVMRSA